MRLLFETLDSGVFVTDSESKVGTANCTAIEMFGLPLESKTCSELFETVGEDGSARRPHETPLQRALATRLPLSAEVVGVRHPTRGMIWLLESAHPVLAPDHSFWVLS